MVTFWLNFLYSLFVSWGGPYFLVAFIIVFCFYKWKVST